MRINVNSKDLMLGTINLYKQILECDKQEVLISAMDKKLDTLAKQDDENFDKLSKVNKFNLNAVRQYGNLMNKKLDNITK